MVRIIHGPDVHRETEPVGVRDEPPVDDTDRAGRARHLRRDRAGDRRRCAPYRVRPGRREPQPPGRPLPERRRGAGPEPCRTRADPGVAERREQHPVERTGRADDLGRRGSTTLSAFTSILKYASGHAARTRRGGAPRPRRRPVPTRGPPSVRSAMRPGWPSMRSVSRRGTPPRRRRTSRAHRSPDADSRARRPARTRPVCSRRHPPHRPDARTRADPVHRGQERMSGLHAGSMPLIGLAGGRGASSTGRRYRKHPTRRFTRDSLARDRGHHRFVPTDGCSESGESAHHGSTRPRAGTGHTEVHG